MSETIDVEAERVAFSIAREGVHYCDCMLEGWLARARLAAEREMEMAAEIRQLHENLKYQRLRNASADDQFHAIAKYFGGKDATNVETGEKTIAGLVRQECDRLKDLLRRCLPHVEVYGNLRAEIEAALAKWEER